MQRQPQAVVKEALLELDNRHWESLTDLDVASKALLETLGWTLEEWEAREQED